MENEKHGELPVFSHVEPVLAVQDLPATIEYWQNILGFPVKWTWGNPVNHGGVSWQKVFIQFTLAPELATVSKGNSIWIRLMHIEALYRFHQHKNADIVSPLENKPWGLAQYTVREINGYYLHFAAPVEDRNKSDTDLPASVKIINRRPTVDEYFKLTVTDDTCSSKDRSLTEKKLEAALYSVVAVDTASDNTIGCALLLGDDVSFYYVKDVFVLPEWQGKRVGTALMEAINDWLERNATNKSLVALICRETLEPFYQQFGFAPAFSMVKYMWKED
jgi:GNAT superfamily N-acetyltransferase/catechol 2,3-dioxygenase-like lactoylglutathione lyase family enzyme